MQNYIIRQPFVDLELFSFIWEGKRSRSKLETLFESGGQENNTSPVVHFAPGYI